MRVRSNLCRLSALGVLIVLFAAACGNSKSQSATTNTTVNTGPAATVAPAADLTKFVPGRGPGVDDNKKEIRVAVITTATNPIGGKYAQYADGVQAYFDMINAQGGIYGRKLVIVKRRDDQVGLQNVQQVQSSLADDNAFATFVATLQFTGADLLAKANQPTFIWNINPEMATPKDGPSHANIFGSVGALCFSCAGPYLPWLATQSGFSKVGILAYSKATSAESGLCADGTRESYTKYAPNIRVAFFDDSLPFAADITADVTRMKEAGVQFINTCMDTNEVTKLAREMKHLQRAIWEALGASGEPVAPHERLTVDGWLFDALAECSERLERARLRLEALDRPPDAGSPARAKAPPPLPRRNGAATH